MKAQLVGAFLKSQFVSMTRWTLLNVLEQLCLDKLYLSASQPMQLLHRSTSIYSIIMSVDGSNLV